MITPCYIPDASHSGAVRPPLAGWFARTYGATSGYFGLKCPPVGPSIDWTMPAADAAGCLQSNGSGTLSFGTPTTDLTNAVILIPGNSTRNVVQPSGPTVVPFVCQGAASQSGNLQQWQDSTGAVQMSISSAGLISKYNSIATSGVGVPTIVGYGRSAPVVAATVSSICTFTPTADGSFQVGGNMNITTLGSGVIQLQVAYTDETGASRSEVLPLSASGGTSVTAANTGQVFASLARVIRAKGGTSITLKTTGTVTGCTYNTEAYIIQIA
jgi:hypothetical protein